MQLSEVFHVSFWQLSTLVVSEAVEATPPFKHTNRQKAAPVDQGSAGSFYTRAALRSPSCYTAIEASAGSRQLQGGDLPAVGAAAAESARGFPADVSLSKTLNQLLCNSLTSPGR